MPIIKSAQKKLRKDKKRTALNVETKKAYKAAVKVVTKTAHDKKKVDAKKAQSAQSKIDKAAKKHLIHPNKAARLKSRVSKLSRGSK